MATRVEKIVQRSRDILADENGSRWSDSKMLRWFDEAYEYCVMSKGLLRSTAIIPIIEDMDVIELPEDVHIPTRVTYNGKKIDLLTHDYLDNQLHLQNPANVWEDETGKVLKALVKDKQNIRMLKPYPIIRDPEVNLFATIFHDPVTVNGEPVTVNGEPVVKYSYGEVESIDDSLPIDVYGFLSDISFTDTDNVWFSSYYGVLASIEEADELKVYYKKKNNEILSFNDELEVDSVYLDSAIKYYIVGLALSADMDTQDNVMSNKYFNLSEEYIGKIEDLVAENFTQTDYNLKYRGFV